MERAGRIAAILVGAALSGCDPGWTIHGQVVEPALSSAPGAPLRGALAVLRCARPAEAVDQVASADEQGFFQLQGPGPGPRLDCALTIALNGYGPVVFTLDQICADADEDEDGERCLAAALQAELTPQQR